jgi:hypothetical protein
MCGPDHTVLHSVGRRDFEEINHLNLLELCREYTAKPRIEINQGAYFVRFLPHATSEYIGYVERCVVAAGGWPKLQLWLIKRVREIRREQLIAMRERKAA